MKYSFHQDSSVIHGWFVFLIRIKRVEKSQAIPAFLDGFQELQLDG